MNRPARQTVMGRRTRQALAEGGRPGLPDLGRRPAAPADPSELAVLLRVHRRVAARTMCLLFAGLLGLPLVLALLPDLTAVTVLGVPVLWLLLGAASYPLLLLLGYRHLVRVERLEHQLARPERDPA